MPEAGAELNPLPARGSVLAFDYGYARIGVAVGELETRSARALTTLAAQPEAAAHKAIAALVAEWHPALFVVGVPLPAAGTEATAISTACEQFARSLSERFRLPVRTVDEAYSSTEADARLRAAGVRDWQVRKQQLDAVAAELVLEQFLESTRHAIS